jgi:hypothetical protein
MRILFSPVLSFAGLMATSDNQVTVLPWNPNPVTLTAEAAFNQTPDESRRSPARSEAADFLKDILKDGPVWVDDIQEMAKRELLSWSAIKKAKLALNIFSERFGFGKDSRCYWRTTKQDKTPPREYNT